MNKRFFVCFILLIAVSLKMEIKADPVVIYSGTYIQNPKGNSVPALIFTGVDYDDNEKQAIINNLQSVWPNATILGEPTYYYNCHGYAWNMVDGGITCSVDYISYYITDNSYVLTTEPYAEKIVYNSADHSAVLSPTVSGKYESKWASEALMRHDPDYCPSHYMSTGRSYYRKDIYIRGHQITTPSTSTTLSVGYIPLGTTLTWTCSSTMTKMSSSGLNAVFKANSTSKTTGTVTATFKDGYGNDKYTYTYTVYLNKLPPFGSMSLRVVRSSDGLEVYPSSYGLCPNTFYYAYLTGASANYSYNWDMNHATVYSSNSGQAYFQTDSQGYTFFDLYATDTPTGVTEKVYSATLYGGNNCN